MMIFQSFEASSMKNPQLLPKFGRKSWLHFHSTITRLQNPKPELREPDQSLFDILSVNTLSKIGAEPGGQGPGGICPVVAHLIFQKVWPKNFLEIAFSVISIASYILYV